MLSTKRTESIVKLVSIPITSLLSFSISILSQSLRYNSYVTEKKLNLELLSSVINTHFLCQKSNL